MKRLNQYLVFGLLIVFSLSLLPFNLLQQNQLLEHLEAIQSTDKNHHCEFDQWSCQAQILNHACEHSGHLAGKSTIKQGSFFQSLLPNLLIQPILVLHLYSCNQFFTTFQACFSNQKIAQIQLRGPPAATFI